MLHQIPKQKFENMTFTSSWLKGAQRNWMKETVALILQNNIFSQNRTGKVGHHFALAGVKPLSNEIDAQNLPPSLTKIR